MSRGLRKFVLTLHVTFTVGWLGAVIAFMVLAIQGITNQDVQIVRATYIAMQPIARYVIVPLSFLPLLTGPILSLGTPWGLFRHYWIIAKLIITILCTVIMQLHMQPIDHLAEIAANSLAFNEVQMLQTQMVIASGAALVALLVATILAVYKLRGMTAYGWRKQYQEKLTSSNENINITD